MSDVLLKDGDSYKDLHVYNGDIALCDDDSDVIQQAINSINTRIKGIPFHPTYGNAAIGNRMKYINSYLDTIKDGCTDAILLDRRVSDVSSIDVQLDDEYKSFAVVFFTIVTIDGRELSSSCGVELR